ncbi:MAG: DUF559 domain-containing protein [Anaerolineae bacterium]
MERRFPYQSVRRAMQVVAILACLAVALDLLNILPGMGARMTPIILACIILYALYDGDQLSRIKHMVRDVKRDLNHTNKLPKTRETKKYHQPQAQYQAIAWHGLTLRSQSEVKVAKELERRGTMFLAGVRIRLNAENHRQTREVDFLVFYEGKWGILEVDGPHHEHSTQADAWRDLCFREQGIPVFRFPADLCHSKPAAVVDDFFTDLSGLSSVSAMNSALPPDSQHHP